jgi:hypothetical protein
LRGADVFQLKQSAEPRAAKQLNHKGHVLFGALAEKPTRHMQLSVLEQDFAQPDPPKGVPEHHLRRLKKRTGLGPHPCPQKDGFSEVFRGVCQEI